MRFQTYWNYSASSTRGWNCRRAWKKKLWTELKAYEGGETMPYVVAADLKLVGT
jgi:hypothetical protein